MRSPRFFWSFLMVLFLSLGMACGTDPSNEREDDFNRSIADGDDDGEGGDLGGDGESGDQEVPGDQEGDGEVPGDDEAPPGEGAVPGDDETPPGDGEVPVEGGEVFEVPASGGAYYARAVKAGEEIWVSYTAVVDVGGETEEKAHLARFGVDGALVEGPTLIGFDDASRDFHPAIAADENTVYVVWVRESTEGQEIRGRSFDVDDGTARQDEPFRIIIALKDGTQVGTIWKPDLAVMNDGNAVLVAEGLTILEPRVLLQRFDRDGMLVLNGMYVFDSSAHGGQYDPAVTVLSDGTIHYSYLGGEFGAGRVFQGTVAANSDDPGVSPVPAEAQQAVSRSVRFSKGNPSGQAWMVYPLGFEEGNFMALRSANVVGVAVTQTTSVVGRRSIYGEVAASPTGGAIAWMSHASAAPTSGRIHFQRFDATSGGNVTGFGTRVNQHTGNEDARWPYGPSIVWLFGDTYAVFWQERPNNVMTIKGRILEL